MKLTLLNQKDAENIVSQTTMTSFLNINYRKDLHPRELRSLDKAIDEMIEWILSKKSASTRAVKSDLVKSLGNPSYHEIKPLYYERGKCRVAVWVYQAREVKKFSSPGHLVVSTTSVIVYHSKDGFEIDMERGCEPKFAARILNNILAQLSK